MRTFSDLQLYISINYTTKLDPNKLVANNLRHMRLVT